MIFVFLPRKMRLQNLMRRVCGVAESCRFMATCAFVIGYPGAGKSWALQKFLKKGEGAGLTFNACSSEPPNAAWLETADKKIVVIGRFAGRHPATSGVTETSACQGADRIAAGVGTKAVRDSFKPFKDAGTQLVIVDTIRSTLLNMGTMDAARAAGFRVCILELNTPHGVAQERARARSVNESTAAKASVQKHFEKWTTARQRWRSVEGYEEHTSASLDTWLSSFLPLPGAGPVSAGQARGIRDALHQALRAAGARLDIHENHTNVYVLPGDNPHNCLVRVILYSGLGLNPASRAGRKLRIHLALGGDRAGRDLEPVLSQVLGKVGVAHTFEDRASKSRHRRSLISEASFDVIAKCVVDAHAELQTQYQSGAVEAAPEPAVPVQAAPAPQSTTSPAPLPPPRRTQAYEKKRRQPDEPTSNAVECNICFEQLCDKRWRLACGHARTCLECIEQIQREKQRSEWKCPECKVRFREASVVYL